MTIDELKEVQRINFELLCEVNKICEKYNIEYFLIHGTLLGAVRHKGTIPWDDDVDIAMTRENYQRFIKIAKKELSTNTSMFIMGSGSTRYVSELKIGRTNTLYYAPGTENLKIVKFVHLDVFLLDTLKKPNKIKLKAINALRFIKLNWDEKKLILMNIDNSAKRHKVFYKVMVYLSSIPRFIIGEKNMEHIIYNIAVDKTGKSNYMGPVMDIKCFFWNKNDFMNSIKLEYEGNMFPAPIGYDRILKNNYGDYMTEPDENNKYRPDFDSWIFRLT